MRIHHFAYFIIAAWIVKVPCLYANSTSTSIQEALQSQRINNATQQPATNPENNQQSTQPLSVNDQNLKATIEQKLQSLPWNTKNIEIEVRNGRVTLRGQVENYEQLQMVEKKLNDLSDITLINNQLEISSGKGENRWNSRDVTR